MFRYRSSALAAGVLVAAVVAVVVVPGDAAPPLAPMLAALVAAGTAGLAETVAFAAAGTVAGVVLARYVTGLRGMDLTSRGLFAAAIGALAIALATRRRREQRQFLEYTAQHAAHQFGAALLSAHTELEVAQQAVEHARALGASLARCAVHVSGDTFQYLSDIGVPPDLPEGAKSFTVGDDDPVAAAMGAGGPHYWSHPDGDAVTIAGVELESFVVLPLIGAHETIGAYVLGFDVAQPFDDAQRAVFELWGAQLSVVLERARLADFERAVAEELQRSLLGPPKFVEGVGTASRYLPAVSALTVGGDWHDTMQLGGGRIGIAVGDVVGHGLPAASVMGQLRAALDACAIRATNSAEAIESLHIFASNLPESESTTVAFAIVDPAHETVDYCSAGHPPPLCIDADGGARFLDEGQSWPLGLEFTAARRHAEASLPAGALLLLYSDGLIERRSESLDVGFERLRAAAVERHLLPLDRLCDELIEILLQGSDRRDDVVLLALRTPVSSPRLFLRKEPATPEALAPLRRDLREWLAMAGLDEYEATDLLIAAGEACMNAVQHADDGARHRLFRVEGCRIGDEIILTITDTGSWREGLGSGTGGRGIQLVRRLVESVEIVRRESGTAVTLRHHIEESRERAPVPA